MKDLHIKVEQETYIMLVQKENYNLWIRTAIYEKLEKELEPAFIDAKIKDLKTQIQELEKLKKVKPANEDKIRDLLAYHAPAFKQNAMHRSEAQRFKFIEKAVMPNLKKLGFKGSVKEIDDLLIDWPEE